MGLIVSGVQPTGNLHLGNYLGAIKNWVNLQRENNLFFFIADLHAITVFQNPEELRENVLKVAALYIACGIDPEKSTIFAQSSVSGHAELAWILSCNTPIGWLNRMTQFKDKAGKDKEKASLGLYSYPVLMAADILLYNATHVPVGDDQRQHLELARDIAAAFNRDYKTDFFNIPEPQITGKAARVMSLRDGTRKMSKSEPSDYSRINLTDSADTIREKIKKAKSDMAENITYDPETRPELANLLNIISALYDNSVEENLSKHNFTNFSHFKEVTAQLIVEKVEPIQKRYHELMNDKTSLKSILAKGAANANEAAEKNLGEVKKLVGLI